MSGRPPLYNAITLNRLSSEGETGLTDLPAALRLVIHTPRPSLLVSVGGGGTTDETTLKIALAGLLHDI